MLNDDDSDQSNVTETEEALLMAQAIDNVLTCNRLLTGDVSMRSFANRLYTCLYVESTTSAGTELLNLELRCQVFHVIR